MNLRRQLLLVSLLTLMLPWAGCEFIRETESALRAGQQQMLAGTARAVASSLSQYAEEFPVSRLFVDARVLSIFEGADETLCLKVIARQLTANARA